MMEACCWFYGQPREDCIEAPCVKAGAPAALYQALKKQLLLRNEEPVANSSGLGTGLRRHERVSHRSSPYFGETKSSQSSTSAGLRAAQNSILGLFVQEAFDMSYGRVADGSNAEKWKPSWPSAFSQYCALNSVPVNLNCGDLRTMQMNFRCFSVS